MKKFPGIIVLLTIVFIMSCKDDKEDTWTQYQKWRNENAAYFRKGQKRMKTDFRFTQKFIRFGIREVLF